MVNNWLGFFLFYAAICAIPALILLARGRGWRPRNLALTLLVGWTGGGLIIMLWLALAERSGNFTRDTQFPNSSTLRENSKDRRQASRDRRSGKR
jgi:hypothetical protein